MKIAPTIHILAVDDEPDLCALTKVFLEKSKDMEVDIAFSVREAMIAISEKRYDAIVSDYQMPGEDGIQFLKSLRTKGDRTPFILFTGKGREEVVIEALNSGVDSYLQKGGNPVPQYAELGHRIMVLVQRSRAEKATRDSEERLKQLADRADQWIWEVDANGLIMYSNQVVERILGYEPEELVGKVHFFDLKPPEDRELIKKKVFSAFEAKLPIRGLINNGLTKSGKIVLMETSGIPVVDETGQLTGYRGTNKDITERKRAEDALADREEYLRTILQTTADGFWMLDIKGNVTEVNETYCRMSGYSRDEMLRLSVSDLEAIEDQNETATHIQHLIKNGSELFETRHRRKDGSVFDVEVSATFMPKGFDRIICFCRDITERKKAEEALRESERRFHSYIYNAPDGIFIVDETGRYLEVNPAACKITGYEMEELLGMHIPDLLPPESLEAGVRNFKEVIESGHAYSELTFLHKDGSLQHWSIDAVRLSPTRFLGFVKDVTERKRTEEALYGANRKLNLLSGITRHDINTQLMIIEGNLALMEKKQLDLSSEENLKKVEAAAERISAMIQFTKEYEDIGIHSPIWQDVRTLVRTASEDVSLEKMKVVNDIRAGTEVFADPLIKKVFYNLILNALQHSRCATIRFSLGEQDGVHFIVGEDDGVGIPEEIKRNLFTKGFGKNNGFGLFLSREILAITGITITEEGEPPRGARFVMAIPAGGLRELETGNKL